MEIPLSPHLAVGGCPFMAGEEDILVDAAAVGCHGQDGVGILYVYSHRVDTCMHAFTV